MYKKYYQRFLAANPGKQHYASHSHHYWPDVTRVAMLEYWDDSAKYVDDKWNYIFSRKIPATQKQIARILNLSKPQQIVFAPNTHEFVNRILSCFHPQKTLRVLTSDSEFYSFDRQINRLAEDHNIQVTKLSTQPFADFQNRFIQELEKQNWDLVFISQVFFNSGFVIQDLKDIAQKITNPETMIVIDGYHAFMALPTDLSAIEDRVFYIAGSYKYAQGGEGCCFMSVPSQTELRPANTGWFAGFSQLSGNGGAVSYADNGFRFAGSTMDFSALYRLQAVLELFEKENISVEKIHAHVQNLQKNFLQDIANWKHPQFRHHLNEKNLLYHDLDQHGHFLTFDTKNAELTRSLHDAFRDQGILTDYRGSRWRFGFGLYQEPHIDLSRLN